MSNVHNCKTRWISEIPSGSKRSEQSDDEETISATKITDMLQKLEGFMFGTSLDLDMGYHHTRLKPFSRRLCTIVLPWGKSEYCQLHIGFVLVE